MRRFVWRLNLGLCTGFIALALTGAPAFAQVAAAISGTVEDQAGGAVKRRRRHGQESGDGVVADYDDRRERSLQSAFSPFGPAGSSGEKQGFKREVRTGIDLIVGQELALKLKLELGEVSQEVTLSAEGPVVNTATAEVSGFVGQRAVKDLPLNGRSLG